MNLEKLLKMQRAFDDRIIDKHELDGQELFLNKIIALKVELGELANEWQGFKYWKEDPQPKPDMLEEFVDCLHFILSIGLELEFNVTEHYIHNSFETVSIIDHFDMIYDQISTVKLRQTIDSYQTLLEFFLGLGERLGFTPEMIEAAYLMKNKVNHERQDQGY
ncbi:dUTP diphosphatase [Metabacillus halosaccharovorans]|uniref:dUTP diphosphatase n=1 Tax=Metabacillus halosaccharovorans TaxID=930124 RepID=A0ABT3DH03_9BACI|nr:dUTP diphosphatase [Metabacillus halosaccharovorans]MCV9886262.1 dUTP diphosphatase [Metabacillus halosaccharovorans]